MKSERSISLKQDTGSKAGELVEHFFRHEYGRLVAALSARLGHRELAQLEDAAQSALMAALETWPVRGIPDRPSAWLYRVAYNGLLDVLRKSRRREKILQGKGELLLENSPPDAPLPQEFRDDQLRFLFLCCHPAIPFPSQLALALKTLCGFSVNEIALRLFTTEANVYKRLTRARKKLRELPDCPTDLQSEDYQSRLPAVNQALYLLFTEGYLSCHPERALRRELCDEALRLGNLLTEHQLGENPESRALMALMHLHRARLDARRNEQGDLLLLEEQDRNLWDQAQIHLGLHWLARSAQGPRFSRYHAEAGIAAEHCLAPSFQETRWENISELYGMLECIAPSPVHRLQRAVAVAEWQGAKAGLTILQSLSPPEWLLRSYLWHAVLGDLQYRCGLIEEARSSRRSALREAPSEPVRELLQRRWRLLED